MKKIYAYILLCLLFKAYTSIAQTCTAIPVVTLNPGGVGPIGAQLMVTYNPVKNVYYWMSGGFASNPVATHPASGGPTVAVGFSNHDWRGMWWNSNTNTLEGNCNNSAGIYTTVVSGIGHAMGGSTIVASNNQPNLQSGGQYDPVNNHVIYYNNGFIFKYSRSTGLLISTVAISGLPVGLGNIAFYGFYTGIPGMEYAVFDYNNRRAYYINYNTGAYVSTVQFPPSAGSPAAFALSYTNGLFFIFDDVNWIGYSAGLNAYSSSYNVCPGTSVILRGVNGSGYLWSTGANTSSIIVTPTTSTSYSVAATTTAGCPSTMTITVNTLNAPMITTSGNTLICGTGTNIITASGAISYTWNNGSTSSTISASPNSSTVYTVTGTNTLGCTASKTVSVLVDNYPTLSVNGASISCAGQPNVLQVNGASTYSWNNGTQTFSTIVSPFSTTVYSVTGTSSAGCVSVIDHTINVIPAPNLVVTGNTSICPGGTIVLSASGADTYSWSTGANTNTISDVPPNTKSYTIVGTSTVNGCSSSLVKTVTVSPEPSVFVTGDGVLCKGLSTTITASGANSYTWNNGANTATIVESPTVNTSYTVMATSAAGCTGSASAFIEVAICTGIDNNTSSVPLIGVYPNPNSGEFVVSIPDASDHSELQIFSAIGQLVSETSLHQGNNAISLSETPGIYLLVIKDNNRTVYTTRVVKQ